MIDPIILATISSAVTVLATEYGKGIVGKAAEETWEEVKSLFGWDTEPPLQEIPAAVARSLQEAPDLAPRVIQVLQANQNIGNASQLVGKVSAKNVTIAETVHVINMQG